MRGYARFPGIAAAPLRNQHRRLRSCLITVRALGVVLLPFAASCSRAVPGASVVRSDSAEVEIVESASPQWGSRSPWSVADNPSVSIGDTDDRTETNFSFIRDLAVLSDGRMLVLDGASQELRVFSAVGSVLAVRGGRGDGPREFRNMHHIAVTRSDSITVLDAHGKAVVYGPDLSFVRTYRVPTFTSQLLVSDAVSYSVIDTDARTLPPDAGLVRPKGMIVRLGRTGSVLDTVMSSPGVERVLLTDSDGPVGVSPIFGHSEHFGLRGDTLLVGSADFLGYLEVFRSAHVCCIVRARGYDLALPRGRTEAELAFRSSYASPRVRAFLERIPLPTQRPAYSRLVVDSRGYVWLGEPLGVAEHDRARRWEVISPSGKWMGGVVMPPGLDVYAISVDGVIAVQRDSLDREVVRRFPVTGRERPN